MLHDGPGNIELTSHAIFMTERNEKYSIFILSHLKVRLSAYVSRSGSMHGTVVYPCGLPTFDRIYLHASKNGQVKNTKVPQYPSCGLHVRSASQPVLQRTGESMCSPQLHKCPYNRLREVKRTYMLVSFSFCPSWKAFVRR